MNQNVGADLVLPFVFAIAFLAHAKTKHDNCFKAAILQNNN